MKGTVIKRGNRWSVVIDMGRDPVTGKRVRKWHSGFRLKRDAEAARVAILSQLQRGEYVAPEKQTVGGFLIEEWLPAIEASVRPSTFDSYRATVQGHIVPHIGSVALQKLAPGQLNALYAHLLTAGRRDGKGGLSARSVRYVHAVVHRAMRDALKWHRVVRNPAEAAEPPRQPKTQQKTWTATQLRLFLDHAQGDRLAAAWTLAAMTGMRRGEVLGLLWSDVDLKAGRLSVTRTLVSVAYQLKISEPKTAKGHRTVALDGGTVRVLKAHRRRQAEEQLRSGADYNEQGLVFADELGNFVHPDGFSKRFKRLQIAACVPVIRFHDLRHTHATMALQAGIHPRVVSERLGHSTVTMTLDTYSHVLPAMQEDAAERVASLLIGTDTSPSG